MTLNQEVLQRRYLHRTRPLPLTEERQRQSSCGLRHGDGSITCISFHNLNIILGTVPVLAADWLRPDQLSSIQTCQQCSTLHNHTELQLLLVFWKYPCDKALCKQAIAVAFSDYWCLLECYEATKLFLVPTVIHKDFLCSVHLLGFFNGRIDTLKHFHICPSKDPRRWALQRKYLKPWTSEHEGSWLLWVPKNVRGPHHTLVYCLLSKVKEAIINDFWERKWSWGVKCQTLLTSLAASHNSEMSTAVSSVGPPPAWEWRRAAGDQQWHGSYLATSLNPDNNKPHALITLSLELSWNAHWAWFISIIYFRAVALIVYSQFHWFDIKAHTMWMSKTISTDTARDHAWHDTSFHASSLVTECMVLISRSGLSWALWAVCCQCFIDTSPGHWVSRHFLVRAPVSKHWISTGCFYKLSRINLVWGP